MFKEGFGVQDLPILHQKDIMPLFTNFPPLTNKNL